MVKTKKIGIFGTGKMGTILKAICERQGDTVVFFENGKLPVSTSLISECDAIVEFTHPETAPHLLQTLLQQNACVISGSTGWDKTLLSNTLKSTQGAFLHATNYSMGAMIQRKLIEVLSQYSTWIGKGNIQIKEKHHRYKVDAPSGTAKTLAQDIEGLFPHIQDWSFSNRKDTTIAMEVWREKEHIGEHTVLLSTEQEEIEITHRALKRSVFVEGAWKCAHWITGKKGIFTLENVISDSVTQ